MFNLKGFFFSLRGKVGVTSNAKKKSAVFKLGPSNKSNKSQKMDFQQSVVKASSGTSGLLLIMTYY